MASCIRRERRWEVRPGQVSQEPRKPLEGVQAERRRLDSHDEFPDEALTSSRFCVLAGCKVCRGNF